MMSLSSLPNELLLQISAGISVGAVRFLPPSTDRYRTVYGYGRSRSKQKSVQVRSGGFQRWTSVGQGYLPLFSREIVA